MKDTAAATQRSGSRLKGLLAGPILLALTSAVCLLLMEGAVRLLFPFFSPQAQVPFAVNAEGVPLGIAGQTVRQATPKGDYDTMVHFNAIGFRDAKDLQYSKDTDWFALGDSFTMGWGVDEELRYSNRLEQLLKTNGSSAAVYNIAIPENIVGYAKLLKYAERHGGKVRQLIVGICMENDLREYSDGKGDWDPAPRPAHLSPKELLRSVLRRHSALYTAVSFSLQKSPACRQWLEKLGVARDIEHLSGENSGDEGILLSSRDKVVQLVSGYDAVILLIPSRRLWHGPTMDVERRVHEHFGALLRDAGLTVVDPKAAFEKGGKPLDYYFKTDPHWNPQGHALAAQELSQAIALRSTRPAAAPAATLSTQAGPLP